MSNSYSKTRQNIAYVLENIWTFCAKRTFLHEKWSLCANFSLDIYLCQNCQGNGPENFRLVFGDHKHPAHSFSHLNIEITSQKTTQTLFNECLIQTARETFKIAWLRLNLARLRKKRFLYHCHPLSRANFIIRKFCTLVYQCLEKF